MKSFETPRFSHIAVSSAPLLLAVLLGGCAAVAPGGASGPTADPRAACAALDRSLGTSITGVALDGVRIDSAELVDPGKAAFCKVKGQIAATKEREAAAFELRLPGSWNGHAVQFGDGIAGKRLPVDPDGALMAGYATYGKVDGGAAGGATVSADAALTTQKALRDAAAELLARRFDRFPDQFYLVASDSGATAAVAMVERHPRAFRGVLADAGGANTKTPASGDPTESLRAFSGSGGKLVVRAPAGAAADEAPLLALQRALAARIGSRGTEAFLRVYRERDAGAPGVELLKLLVDWAEKGKEPPPSGDRSGAT